MTPSRDSNCSGGDPDPYGEHHMWELVAGHPLACLECGAVWPGAPLPEYVCRVEGNHQEEIRNSGMWSVRDMINAMKAMEV